MFCSRVLSRAVTAFLINEERRKVISKTRADWIFFFFFVTLERWSIKSVKASEDAAGFGISHRCRIEGNEPPLLLVPHPPQVLEL